MTSILSITSALAASYQEVPPEVLSNIFLLSTSKPIQIPVSYYDAPWNITQVCSKWRHVALDTPKLWNNIHISVDSLSAETEESCNSMMEQARLFLLRAGRSAIYLTLEAEEDTMRACMAVLFFVVPHLPRLHSLSLVPVERFRFPLQLDWGTTNNLESLSLSFDFGPLSGNLSQPPASSLKGFDRAHNLRTLTISSEHAHLEPQFFKLPWSQLTRLEFNQTTIPFTEGHEVLRQCVNLVSLRLGILPDDECDFPRPDTLLPHLESLTVFVDLEGEYGQFLWPFVLPSLKHFEIESEDGSIWPEDGSHALNAKSLQNLEQIRVTHMEPLAILPLLVDAPSLIKLSICSLASSEANDLLEFTTAICDGDIVPILRVLECDAGMADWLVDILKARAKVVGQEGLTSATLESVIIHGGSADVPAIKESLAVFSSRGVDVEYVQD